MNWVMLVCRSQTEAFQCLRMLQGAGISGALKKPVRKEKDSSCVWGVRIRAQDMQTALERMKEKNFQPLRMDSGSGGGI